MRVLFTTAAMRGHFYPVVSTLWSLRNRGHGFGGVAGDDLDLDVLIGEVLHDLARIGTELLHQHDETDHMDGARQLVAVQRIIRASDEQHPAGR